MTCCECESYESCAHYRDGSDALGWCEPWKSFVEPDSDGCRRGIYKRRKSDGEIAQVGRVSGPENRDAAL